MVTGRLDLEFRSSASLPTDSGRSRLLSGTPRYSLVAWSSILSGIESRCVVRARSDNARCKPDGERSRVEIRIANDNRALSEPFEADSALARAPRTHFITRAHGVILCSSEEGAGEGGKNGARRRLSRAVERRLREIEACVRRGESVGAYAERTGQSAYVGSRSSNVIPPSVTEVAPSLIRWRGRRTAHGAGGLPVRRESRWSLRQPRARCPVGRP